MDSEFDINAAFGSFPGHSSPGMEYMKPHLVSHDGLVDTVLVAADGIEQLTQRVDVDAVTPVPHHSRDAAGELVGMPPLFSSAHLLASFNGMFSVN